MRSAGVWLQGLVPYGDDDDLPAGVRPADPQQQQQQQQQARGEGGAGPLYKSTASTLFNRGAGATAASPKGGQKSGAPWFPQHISTPLSGGSGGQQQAQQQQPQQQHPRAVNLQVRKYLLCALRSALHLTSSVPSAMHAGHVPWHQVSALIAFGDMYAVEAAAVHHA